MPTFDKFEDIHAWEKSRDLAVEVYRSTAHGPFSKDFELRNQLRRSATSIMANIAEGQGRRTNKDFAHFLNISLGSIAETKSHLYLAKELGYLSEKEFNDIHRRADEVGRMVMSLSNYLRNNP